MSTNTSNSHVGQNILLLIVLVIVIIGGVWFINHHSHRTAGEQIGSAIDSLPGKADKATDDVLAPSTMNKAGDALSKTGDAASSAVVATGKAASSAVSETSADVKAAADKQKQQDKQNGKADDDQ